MGAPARSRMTIGHPARGNVVRISIPRLAVLAAVVFLGLGIVQLIGSLLFYQAIDRQTLRADHARRIAELIVVSDRIHSLEPNLAAPIMTTGRGLVGTGHAWRRSVIPDQARVRPAAATACGDGSE